MSAPYTPGYGQPPIYNTKQVNFGWIAESWQIYLKALVPWFLLLLFPTAFSIFYAVHTYTTPQMLALFHIFQSGNFDNPANIPPKSAKDEVTANLLMLAQYVMQYLVACCASDIAVRQVRGETIANNSIFRGMRNWLQMLIFWILMIISVFAGAIACCVGMFVAYGLLMAAPALVADGESATDAFSRSIEGLKRDWLSAGLFAFVFNILLGFGILATCYLGLFVLHPMMYIISALAYRDMIGMPKADGSGMVGGMSAPAPWQQYSQPGFSPQSPGIWPPAPSAGQPPQYGRPPYGQPPMGQPPYGQPPAANQPPFGQTPPPNQPPAGPPPNDPEQNSGQGQ